MHSAQHIPAAALIAALGASLLLGCEREPPPTPEQQRFEHHHKHRIGAPGQEILTRCGGSVCALVDHDVFAEIEYVMDKDGTISGVLLKAHPPTSPSLHESQEIFRRTRAILQTALGEGQSYLKSGDPTYWPARDASERIVTLTTTDGGQTVLAVGAVGPDAERIPADGPARDRAKAQKQWETIATSPSLLTKRPDGT
ncbi:MAG: hypothetical protein CMH57_13630 [Myxococcales bacterium]|nr:hypothetical protein [Myxococcales bacterium]